jgi:hypothetical protein
MAVENRSKFGRCFGQDIIKGEWDGNKGGVVRKANGIPTGSPKGDIDCGLASGQSGTSIFDPVLCELAYRWFCPPGGLILDPFAGGSVRGIVAAKLGRRYVGVDLREEQVVANRAQLNILADTDPAPVWMVGDSRNIAAHVGPDWPGADFLFSCPPYADLEVYSDNPADLSTLDYEEFRKAYAGIIAASCRLVNPDRFACFVVGDVRDKKGFYRGFPWHTIAAFDGSGFRLYNEAVLVTVAGSLPIRAGRAFESSRKLGKTHQNILVFCNGDPKKATAAIGPVECGGFDEDAMRPGI